ncbi:MAG: hypothetical protein M1830_005250, partial [Pleopsidium flavum]
KEEEIGTGLKDVRPLVAGSLAIYHIAPSVRAVSRIVYGDWASGGGLPEEEKRRSRKGDGRTRWLGGLGGPWVHLVGHAVCFVALGMVFIDEGVWGRGGARV